MKKSIFIEGYLDDLCNAGLKPSYYDYSSKLPKLIETKTMKVKFRNPFERK